jgi:HSP20 family protein
MAITRWEPFREFEDMFRHYSPLLGRSLRRVGGEDTAWTPLANITETDKEYVIKAELPEVKKEDVRITLDNNLITITGERRHEKEQAEENEIHVESFYGTFSRSFQLPEGIDAQAIKAESKDGVLRVRIPKKQLTPPRSISIEVK